VRAIVHLCHQFGLKVERPGAWWLVPAMFYCMSRPCHAWDEALSKLRRVVRNERFFLQNEPALIDQNMELLRSRFPGPNIPKVIGLAPFWWNTKFMSEKKLIYFDVNQTDLNKLMTPEEFFRAWAWHRDGAEDAHHHGDIGATDATGATGATGATCATGALVAPQCAFYIQEECKFGFAVQLAWSSHYDMMTPVCGGPMLPCALFWWHVVLRNCLPACLL